MVQHVRPTTQTKVRVVPRDGELEITLNINVTIDGHVTASSANADVQVQQRKHEEGEDNEDVEPFIPDFSTGLKLEDFGK